MNVFQIESRTKKLLSSFGTKEDAELYIESYLKQFIKKVYGVQRLDNFENYREAYVMTYDDWMTKRDFLDFGHYFVARDDLGYDVYVIFYNLEESTNWLGYEVTRNTRKYVKLFNISAESNDITDIENSILNINAHIINESKYVNMPIGQRIAYEAADIAKSMLHD